MTYDFISAIVKHEILILITSIIIAILVFLKRNIFSAIIIYLHSIPNRLSNFLFRNELKFISKRIVFEESELRRINQDINNWVLLLSNGSNNEKIMAIQYLLLYPSATGFVGLMKFAVKLNDHNSRVKIISALEQSIKLNTWVHPY